MGGSHPQVPFPARSLPRQMPDYKRATLQDDEGPEPAGDGSASPDSVEVRSAPAPPSFPSPSSLAPLLTLSRSLPAARWAAGAGPGAKPALAVPRDVLGGSQNAAESVPGPSSFLAAGEAASTHCQLAGAGALGTHGGMPLSAPRHAAEPGIGEWSGREGGPARSGRPVVRWQVLLLPRWGFGRGRGHC